MRTLAVLGSTGSIGTQTLEVLQRNPGLYDVQLLAAGKNWRLLEQQIRLFRPRPLWLMSMRQRIRAWSGT